MEYQEKVLHMGSRACSCTAELLNVVVSLIVFTVLDIADHILCVVFWALDSILDSRSYCRERLNGVLPENRGLTVSSSQGKLLQGCDNCVSPIFGRSCLHTDSSPPKTDQSSFVSPNADLVPGNIREFAHLPCGHDGSSLVTPTDKDNGSTVTPPLEDVDFFSRSVISRWSDCSCATCIAWQADEKESLYVHVEGEGHENVVFLHGFLSSSLLWSEKVFPFLSNKTRARCRLFAVDLLGFGKSPKPSSCRYTMADHIQRIEESVLYGHKVGSFHLVAHSMGCLVALALAAAHANSIKTITLVAPPYFPAPKDEAGPLYVLRQVAPRRVWPPIAFGASIMSWYEHVGRVVCFVLCKHHKVWEYVIPLLTLNRIPSAAVHDFMQHTHQSAWHIFHNVICGEAHGMDVYLRELEKAGCIVHVLHGVKDIVVPPRCSYQLCERYPTVKLQVFDNSNHFTIIYGHEKLFALTIEKILGFDAFDLKEQQHV